MNGTTLDDITGQLAHFEGQYASVTTMQFGIFDRLNVQTAEDGSRFVNVP